MRESSYLQGLERSLGLGQLAQLDALCVFGLRPGAVSLRAELRHLGLQAAEPLTQLRLFPQQRFHTLPATRISTLQLRTQLLLFSLQKSQLNKHLKNALKSRGSF